MNPVFDVTRARLKEVGIVVDENGAPIEKPDFVDVGQIWDDDLGPKIPEVGEILPNQAMLYRGEINEIHGPPGAGKTFVVLIFALAELKKGNHVFWIDPEWKASRVISRLKCLGGEREEVVSFFHYINPKPPDWSKLHKWSLVESPSLIVIDGAAQAMAQENRDENIALECLQFLNSTVKPFLASNAAVCLSDHVVKPSGQRDSWSRGSGAKKGEYGGAMYSIEVKEPFSKYQSGYVTLTVNKDREGAIGVENEVVMEIHFEPQDGGGSLAYTCKVPLKKAGDCFTPTECMEKVWDFLSNHPGSSVQDIRAGVQYKADTVDKARKLLEKGGFIVNRGTSQRHKWEVLKDYPPLVPPPAAEQEGDPF
jgi:KaiC/GvpD/RAD55 family RecA-like ATPase